MIEEAVSELAEKFCKTWEERLAVYPGYALNYAWPSVGVIDHLTYPLRHKKKFDAEDRALLLGASAYLATLAHDCWSSFSDELKVEVKKSGGENFDIIISAEGGELLKKGERQSIAINQILTQILKDPPTHFLVFPDTERELTAEDNFISLLGSGLMMGLTPYGKGPWVESTEKTMAPYLLAAQDYLADSSANYYSTIFPDEPLGCEKDLYMNHLVYPPAGFMEELIAARGVETLIRYFAEKKLSPTVMLSLSENLAQSPDDLIRCVGFVLSAALCAYEVTPKTKAAAYSLGIMAAKLRPTVTYARILFDLQDNFIDLAEDTEPENAVRVLELDRALGLVPFLTLTPNIALAPEYLDITRSIAQLELETAKRQIEGLKQTRTLSPEMLLQSINLDISLQNLEQAEEDLRSFSHHHLNTAIDSSSLYYELKGSIHILKQNLKAARTVYGTGFHRAKSHPQHFLQLGQLYAHCLIQQKDFQEAESVIERLLDKDSNYIPAILHKYALLKAQGDTAGAKNEQTKLLLLAPFHRAVFQTVL